MRPFYVLFLLLLAGVVAHADTPLLWNQPATPQTCPVGDDAVWVQYAGGAACIRYFSAGTLRNASQALVIFKGDRVALIKRPPQEIPANTADAQRRQAQAIFRRSGLPPLMPSKHDTLFSVLSLADTAVAQRPHRRCSHWGAGILTAPY